MKCDSIVSLGDSAEKQFIEQYKNDVIFLKSELLVLQSEAKLLSQKDISPNDLEAFNHKINAAEEKLSNLIVKKDKVIATN